MVFRRVVGVLCGVVLVGLLAAQGFAQATVATPRASGGAAATLSPAEASQRIAVDPAITVGRLPNGLRYYIRVNNRPEKRAELRLVINAGSVLEDDDQLGLAHFVEHMAFNGSKHFAKQEIGAFMESIGMRFGPSLNAFTSYDDTTYVMQVPTTQPAVIERAFLIMEDWARHLTFEPKEIDKERGVIIEEWRLRRGAAARMQDQVIPVILQGSQYPKRIPIGTKESLETFTHDRLIRFYRDWYRPDLMAVVAVGDFDKDVIERLIKERFGPMPPAVLARPRPTFDVPPQPGTSYIIVKDREMPAATVALYNKLPLREQSTVGSYRERMIDHLYTGMLNDRLAELSQKSDPPFVAANVNRSIFVRSMEAASMTALARPDGIVRALEAMVTESERVARYGFTAAEFEREKRNLVRLYEQAVTEKATQESNTLADEYIRNYLTDESIPGIAWEYEQHQRFLPGITLADVNALGREWYGDRNRVVVVFAPDQPGVVVPTEAELRAIVSGASLRKVDAPVEDTHSDVLMTTLPTPGTVVSRRALDEIGATELTLSNGAKVVLKPTTFKQDEIGFQAFSPGGTSVAPDKDYVAAMTSAQVVSAGGVATYDLSALRKVLAGKLVSVAPSIGDTHEGMAGGGSSKDMETLFQLIHLQFTAPRKDPAVFAAMIDQMKGLLANRQVMPDTVFDELIDTTMAQDHFRARPLSPELLKEMNLETSMAFYRDRYGDASDFTFVFVGSFDEGSITPLITRYLASLPSRNRRETWNDTGITPPRGVSEKTLRKGLEHKARVRLVFSGPFRWTPTDRVAFEVLTMMLEGQLGLVLREEQSGTYGVQVRSDTQRFPKPEYELSVDFSCAPERADELVKLALAEIARIRLNGPTPRHLADTREALFRKYETDSQENSWVLRQLTDSLEYGDPLGGYLALPGLYRQLSVEDVRQVAQRYLDTDNYVRFTLLPEK